MSCDVGEATLLLLHLCHRSFSNPSVASPTSQLILQSLFCFSYITGSSLTSPGEPPMPKGPVSHSSPPRWCPWCLFRSFKVCSDDKERVGCKKQREVGKTAAWVCGGRATAALVPEFAVKDLPLGRTLWWWLILKRPLDGQYFCTIFEVAQWYWTFVGTIERLCNVIEGIKTFWNILLNLEILCRLWVVFRNILSVLLFRFSFLCLSIDYENKMWRKSICYWMYRTV